MRTRPRSPIHEHQRHQRTGVLALTAERASSDASARCVLRCAARSYLWWLCYVQARPHAAPIRVRRWWRSRCCWRRACDALLSQRRFRLSSRHFSLRRPASGTHPRLAGGTVVLTCTSRRCGLNSEAALHHALRRAWRALSALCSASRRARSRRHERRVLVAAPPSRSALLCPYAPLRRCVWQWCTARAPPGLP
jgi:hypothetical protein